MLDVHIKVDEFFFFQLIDNCAVAFAEWNGVYLFRRVRKICEKLVLASLCLSVRPHVTVRFPLDVFPLDSVSEYFSKICLES